MFPAQRIQNIPLALGDLLCTPQCLASNEVLALSSQSCLYWRFAILWMREAVDSSRRMNLRGKKSSHSQPLPRSCFSWVFFFLCISLLAWKSITYKISLEIIDLDKWRQSLQIIQLYPSINSIVLLTWWNWIQLHNHFIIEISLKCIYFSFRQGETFFKHISCTLFSKEKGNLNFTVTSSLNIL